MQHQLRASAAGGSSTNARRCQFGARPRLAAAARRPACRQHSSSSSSSRSVAATATPPSSTGPAQQQPQAAGDEEFVGLLPEEDAQVPGDYWDALNGNTKLGKAVKAAVQELEHLGTLEHDVLEQCDGLLKQLGMQGSLFGSSAGGADADSLLARLQQELLLQEQLEQEQAEEQAQAEQAPKEGGK